MTAINPQISDAPDALHEAERDLPTYLGRYFFNRGPTDLTGDEKRLILNCAMSIHGSIALFIFQSPGKIVRPLERLGRTVNSGGRPWENAWVAMLQKSPAAFYTLCRVKRGRPIPRHPIVPPPAEISPLLPNAMRLARQNTKARPFRDNAVIAILQVYWLATGGEDPTPKRTRALIEGVSKLYSKRGLLPANGLGVTSSAKTMDRLIKMATGKLPIPG